jgi:aryl-alcohol dehydrogenase-like predicted oxidoreductase
VGEWVGREDIQAAAVDEGGYVGEAVQQQAQARPHPRRAHLSARRLGVERIDLYYLHSGRATDAPFEEQVATLAELRAEGVIGNIGLSNVTVEQFHAAQRPRTPPHSSSTPVLVSGGHGSLLTRPDEVAKALLASALS